MLSNYKKWFIDRSIEKNSLPYRRSVILLYMLSSLAILVSLEWLVIKALNLQTDFPLGITAIGLWSLLIIFKLSRSLKITVVLLCGFTFYMIYSSSLNSGGIFSMDLVILYAVSMMAFLLLGSRTGLFFSGISILATAYSYYSTSMNLETHLANRESFDTTYFFICNIMNILVMCTMAYLFSGMNEMFNRKLHGNNEALKSQTEKLHNTQALLLESNRDLEQYAYVTSHDLKQPLKTISSFSRLLEMDLMRKGIGGESLEYLGFISQGTQNMERLINDLLIYARLNSEKKEIFHKTNLYDVLGKAINSLQDQIVRNNVNINVSDVEVEDVYVIPTQIFQLFQNLISNAIKYRASDRNPSIYIKAVERRHDWMISIKDNGLGIKNENLKVIFKPFKRVHQTEDEYQGSGIGLATCSKIIEKHKGKLWVDSEVGVGSIFYFSIPKQHKGRSINPHKKAKKPSQSIAV